MKILYVDLEYDYGIRERGLNSIGRYGFLNSFIRLGFEVESFYYDQYLNKKEELQKKLIEKSDEIKPDIVFFILFEDQFSLSTLEYLKKKYVTVNWFGDDNWRFDSFSAKYSHYFTYSITTDRFSLLKYKNNNIKNVILSQWAAINDNEKIDLEKVEYLYDISFVGGYHPYREWFIGKIEKYGFRVNIFGAGWNNGFIGFDEMKNIFRSSKINLNLGNSCCTDIRYIFSGIRPFINNIRSGKIGSQIKARNFEIPFYGGFEITEYVTGIEQYFDLKNEIVCFNGIDECIDNIRYFLLMEEERENIKRQGFIKAREKHSYLERIRDVMEIICEESFSDSI